LYDVFHLIRYWELLHPDAPQIDNVYLSLKITGQPEMSDKNLHNDKLAMPHLILF